jgi:hypothetical protein
MKQPRVSDFDPHAKEKALKSPMDDFPAIQHQPPQKPADETRPTVPLVPPVPRTGRRKIKQRHPFDIYQDQLDSLKQLAFEERMRGGVGSMSAMVREAIDDLIAKRRNDI